MAQVLKSFKFSEGRSFGEGHYNWDELLDGKARQLTHGEDYNCKATTFRTLARAQAQKRGVTVRIQAVEGGLVIQAFADTE